VVLLSLVRGVGGAHDVVACALVRIGRRLGLPVLPALESQLDFLKVLFVRYHY